MNKLGPRSTPAGPGQFQQINVSDIDQKVNSLNDQTGYLVDLLQKDIEPNDLVNNE